VGGHSWLEWDPTGLLAGVLEQAQIYVFLEEEHDSKAETENWIFGIDAGTL
jgi:hypothetical protein